MKVVLDTEILLLLADKLSKYLSCLSSGLAFTWGWNKAAPEKRFDRFSGAALRRHLTRLVGSRGAV